MRYLRAGEDLPVDGWVTPWWVGGRVVVVGERCMLVCVCLDLALELIVSVRRQEVR